MGRRLITLLALICALAITSTAPAQINPDDIYSEQGPFMAPMEPDPGIPDTVTAQSLNLAYPSSTFELEVYLYNDEELGGFNLPITWNSPDITCDSVSFVGSRIEYVTTKLYTIDNTAQRLQAGMIIFLEQFLQPGNGVIYTAYFTINPAADPQVILVDSTFYPPGGNFAVTLTNGFNVIPQYNQGEIVYGEQEAPEISYAPPAFAFTGVEGGGNPPTQTLNISNSGTGTLEWTLSNNTGWLDLNPVSGTNTGAVDVDVDLTGVSAGTYRDTIVIAANSDNSPQRVPVILTVAAPPPTIQLAPTSFAFTIVQGDALASDQLTVTNTGGGTLNWTATNLTGWLTLTPGSGSGNGIITLNFDVAGVTAGTYHDTITVSDPAATNNPQKVPVLLTIEPPPPTIQLDPVAIAVTADEGSTPPSEQIAVTNVGGGTLDWSAINQTGWISLNPPSGTGNGTITLEFDLTGVTAGIYYDTIFVSDPAATNSPQYTVVTLTVEALPPTIHLDPTTITVTATEGTTPPSEQISITNTGGGTLNWTAGNFDSWMTVTPASGVGDGILTLDFDLTGLAPGTYVDTVSVSDPAATNPVAFTFVILHVEAEAEPDIVISPTELHFNATEGGGNPLPKTFSITNIGGGSFNWTLNETAGWLELDDYSGSGDATITASIDITGLTQGIYTETIAISITGDANLPLAVEVSLTISDFALGMAVMIPDIQHVIRANAIDPRIDTIYIGNFGGVASVNDIDPASITVNGTQSPVATAILPSHPDFTGEVMEILIDARPFILGYGLVFDTTVEEFMVAGTLTDQTIFEAAGEVTFIGHISGDVNRDGVVDIGDPVHLINYIFRRGAAPDPLEIGDVNCDGLVNVGDARFLINYIFRHGPKPNCQQ